MKDVFYAQDTTDIEAVDLLLRQKIQSTPQFHWLALADSAFDYGHSIFLDRIGGLSCYISEDLIGLQSASPKIIEITNHQTNNNKQLRHLIEHCNGRPMLSFICSKISAEELIANWQLQHWAITTDSQRLLLRFADTRVLPQLPKILTKECWAILTKFTKEWLFVDRTGKIAPCSLAPSETISSTKIELSDEQLDQLMKSTEPDTLLDFFWENLPEILPTNTPRSKLHREATSLLTFTRSNQINNWTDIVSLSAAEWLSKKTLIDNQKFISLIQSGKWQTGKLDEKLAGFIHS